MKHLVIISTLLLSACATQQPSWLQDLNSINRQWRTETVPIVNTLPGKDPLAIRAGYSTSGTTCKF
jgi:Tfp pilus assembly protein PilP